MLYKTYSAAVYGIDANIIEVEVDKTAGAITAVRVGGASVTMSEGSIRVD